MAKGGDVQEFSIGLDQYAARLKQTMDVVVRNVVMRIFENVVRLTPVDTGWARANWYVTINDRGDRPGAPNPLPKGNAPVPPAEVASKVLAGRAGDFFWLNNGVPYIGGLEHGHSRQAPYGMVKVSVASAKAFIEEYAKSGDSDKARAASSNLVPGAV